MSESVRSHGFTALGPLHEGLARMRGWPALAIAALLGAFAALAFAPFFFSPALVISFTGLIWMIDGARGIKRWGRAVFARGWAFGFGYILVGMYWTAAPFLVEPEKHAMFLWLPLIVLPGGIALIWGAAVAMAGTFWSSSPSRIFIFSMFFGLAEWLRGHLFGGFPWNLPGTSFAPGGPLSQLASIGGVYWLSLIVILVSVAPAALVDTRDSKGLVGRMIPMLMAVIVLGFGWTWGAQRLTAPTQFTDRTVVLMDVGVPQAEKWTIDPQRVVARYAEFLASVENAPGDIIIWPEGALPLNPPLISDAFALDQVAGRLGERTLIVGTTRVEKFGRNDPAWFNSLAVINRESARSGPIALYDKHRLVPVGELAASRIIPFGEAMSGILPDAMQRMARNGFEPGPGAKVVTADGVPPFLAMICYEGLFPEIPLQAHERAEWIVVISNDAWFGSGMGPAQHHAQNRYRSIESGLPMARVASRGMSAMIDGMGRETMAASVQPGDPAGWKSAVARAALPSALGETVYSRYGNALFWLTLASMVVLAFLTWRR